jgi:hypothetical protein
MCNVADRNSQTKDRCLLFACLEITGWHVPQAPRPEHVGLYRLYCSTALQLAAHELQPDGHVPLLGWHTGRRLVYYTTLLASILQTCNNGGAACYSLFLPQSFKRATTEGLHACYYKVTVRAACVAQHVDPLQVQPAPVATSLATSLCCCMIPQQSIDAIALNADPSVAACCWYQSNKEGNDKMYSSGRRQPVKICNINMRACPVLGWARLWLVRAQYWAGPDSDARLACRSWVTLRACFAC